MRTGSRKCSCRWSTYSSRRSSSEPERDVVEHRQVLDVLAQSDAARMRADRHAELRRHQQHREHLVDAAQPAASIWQKSIASACRSCLNITRLWQCSPVATPIAERGARGWRHGRGCRLGWSALRSTAARTRARLRMFAIASSTSHTWLASIISGRRGPISSRMMRARRRSSSQVAADFDLEMRPAFAPAPRGQADASCRRSSRASRRRSCRPDSRPARMYASRAALPARCA